MIGIIVADEHEINKFSFPFKEKKEVNQFTFHIYQLEHEQLVVVHSGIGLVNAAAATQAMITAFGVSDIYNYGAVGGDADLQIYDLVTPAKIFFHDVVTPWYRRGQTPGEEPFYHNATGGQLTYNLASGNSFLYEESTIREIQRHMDVKIFDMETAAIAQVASKNRVPLHVIKCVSDTIGYDSPEKNDINKRIAEAGKIAFKAMMTEIKRRDFIEK